MTVDNVIEEFYNNTDEVINLFGSLESILFFLYKKGRLDEIDPFDHLLEEYQSGILYYMMTELGDYDVMSSVINIMGDDVEKNGDGGFDLTINEKDKLAELFSYGRYSDDRRIVKKVMGDDWFDPFDHFHHDLQDDMIENLNEENINKLKNLLILKNVKIDLNELLEISTQDEDNPKELLHQLFGGESDIVELSSDNIGWVFNNVKILKYLLMTHYLDIQMELENLYIWSYNDAWVVEITDEIWDNLSTYFDVKDKQWVHTPNTNFHYFKMKIHDGVMQDAIISFLRHTKDINSQLSIIEFSGIIELLQYLMEEEIYEFLKIRTPDYPDYSLVVKNINLGFDEYL